MVICTRLSFSLQVNKIHLPNHWKSFESIGGSWTKRNVQSGVSPENRAWCSRKMDQRTCLWSRCTRTASGQCRREIRRYISISVYEWSFAFGPLVHTVKGWSMCLNHFSSILFTWNAHCLHYFNMCFAVLCTLSTLAREESVVPVRFPLYGHANQSMCW